MRLIFRYSDGTAQVEKTGIVRNDYARRYATIETGRQLRATLRAGRFAWPGGYPMYFITSDGAALSYSAVRDNFPAVLAAVRSGVGDGWRVVATAINYEDPYLLCEHDGDLIGSAYGDEE